ncbi:MAG: M48 family metallopeptidase [Hyphomicrobiales bacterium]|nr:M48 family metallopeptidase [Hyphomicrobiales bacterium]MCP5373363.1 M48 family metallopeptidase [Hyphomicrobiales bacterium]
MPSTSAPSDRPAAAPDIAAVYNDGHTARSHPGRVRMRDGHLEFLDGTGMARCRWPLDEVHLVARPGDGQPARLRHGFTGDARITLDDEADLPRVAAHCPNLNAAAPSLGRTWKPLVFWSAGAAAAVALLFLVVIPWLGGRLAAVVPPAMERDLGETARSQVLDLLAITEGRARADMVCRSDAGDAALRALTDRLLGGRDLGLTRIEVVNSKMVNALALPGGYIMVMRGLLDQAGSPDELAGVVAHELGHVQRRHALIVTLERAGSAAVIGLLLGDVTGGTVLAALGQALVGASYGREAEREADAIGIEIMQRAGGDPGALALFFDRLRRKEGDLAKSMGLFSTHPASEDRIRILRQAAKPASPSPILPAKGWQALRGICGGGSDGD